jgi:two-component system, chemotaxis family, chemotaxis protein CheY
VDDDPVLREMLEQALSAEGYDVEAAGNGLEALSVLPGWRPDLIILDLIMPIMDGWRFRAEQRQTPSADVPVLVLTGHRDAHSASSGMGAVETVNKPFELDQLLDTVQRIVSSASRGK